MSGLSWGVILVFDIIECYHPVVSAALCKLALMCLVFLFSTTSLNLIYRVGTSWSLTNFCNHTLIENSVTQKKCHNAKFSSDVSACIFYIGVGSQSEQMAGVGEATRQHFIKKNRVANKRFDCVATSWFTGICVAPMALRLPLHCSLLSCRLRSTTVVLCQE